MDFRADISDLVHRYSDAVTRRDLDQWASCWSRDGRWELRPDRVASDPESRLAILRHAFSVIEGIVQMVSNGSVVVSAPAAATGRWYIVEHLRRATGEAGLLLGHYDDTYVCEDGHWLFAARALVPHYQGPPDLSGVFTA